MHLPSEPHLVFPFVFTLHASIGSAHELAQHLCVSKSQAMRKLPFSLQSSSVVQSKAFIMQLSKEHRVISPSLLTWQSKLVVQDCL